MKENEKVKFDSHLNSKHDELPVHEYVKDVIFYFKIFTITIKIFHVKCLKSVCPMKVNIQSINTTSTQFFLGTGLPNKNSQLLCMCLGYKGLVTAFSFSHFCFIERQSIFSDFSCRAR